MVENAGPVATSDRIHSLDVLRGFAVLGILLLNILAFGLHDAGYFNPLIAVGETAASRSLNLGVWAGVSVLFEGAMRALFSLRFGAGVVLFTTWAFQLWFSLWWLDRHRYGPAEWLWRALTYGARP